MVAVVDVSQHVRSASHCFVAIWELASAFGWLSPQELAGPSVVVRTGAHMLANGTLKTALWASLQRVFWGLAIGVPLGAALALVSGLSRLGEKTSLTEMSRCSGSYRSSGSNRSSSFGSE